MKKQFFIIVLIPFLAISQTNINRVEYFIDNDPGFNNAISLSITPQSDLQIQFPFLANQIEGVHTMGIRSKDVNGSWSHTNFFPIYIEDNSIGLIKEVEYFWDVDPGFGNGYSYSLTPSVNDWNNGVFQATVPMIGLGAHHLFLRSKDNRGRWSHTNYSGIINITGTLSINDFENKTDCKVFPNPAADFITIQSNNHSIRRALLYTVNGELIIDKIIREYDKIDIQTLSKGVYSLFIFDENNEMGYSTKIIINK